MMADPTMVMVQLKDPTHKKDNMTTVFGIRNQTMFTCSPINFLHQIQTSNTNCGPLLMANQLMLVCLTLSAPVCAK